MGVHRDPPTAMQGSYSAPVTAPQRNRLQAFAPLDWFLLAGVAVMWGSSFVLIDIGLVHLHPTAVAWLRIVFGALTLACVPAARRPIRRADRPLVAVLGIVWMAVPFTLFSVAQESIDSSLAGMINGAAPLFTATLAAVWVRQLPTARQLNGLLIGLVGIVAINLPAMAGAGSTAVGAGLVLLATFCYGIAFNLAVPLEERSGALPVIWRAQLAAAVLVAPAGVFGVTQSSFAWSSLLAMVALGAFSTGAAFAMFATLVGRVGAARGSVTTYFIPVVAIVLGVAFRGDSVAGITLVGTALVLIGAYLTSRKVRAG